jgi:hypothetical protein
MRRRVHFALLLWYGGKLFVMVAMVLGVMMPLASGEERKVVLLLLVRKDRRALKLECVLCLLKWVAHFGESFLLLKMIFIFVVMVLKLECVS